MSLAMNLLELREVEVVYQDAAIAVQGVSLAVPQNSIVCLLGVNGAGKTTTLRAATGFLSIDDAKVTHGTIEFLGERLNGKPPHEIVRKGFVLVPEKDKVFATATVEENLAAPWSRRNGKQKPLLDQVYRLFPVLAERRRQVAGYLSGGQRQMLAIGKALLCEPKLLAIDELSLGLAPLVVQSLMETVTSLNKELGVSVLLVEQNAKLALEVSDYGYVMENGKVVFDGKPEALMAHADIREFYLGISGAGEKSYRDVKQYSRTRRWWG